VQRPDRLGQAIDLPGDGRWIACDLVRFSEDRDCLTEVAAGVARMPRGGIAVDPAAAEQVAASGEGPVWLRAQDGSNVQARGMLLPDFSHPATREWWGRKAASMGDRGASGVMVEGDELTFLHPGAEAAGDQDLGGAGPAEMYRGVMGLLAAKAAWEGLDPEKRDRRVLLVVPTTALGSQRWTAHRIDVGPGGVTTGQGIIAAALNSVMSAQSLVGGFVSGGMPLKEWEELTGTAGLLPIWSVEGLPEGEEAAAAALVRTIASMRHQLLPYYYTQAFGTFFQAQPFLRPLMLEDPANPDLRGIDTAYMVGRDLLVAPRLGGASFDPDVVFPGQWKRLPLGETDERAPAVYMRRGSIVPLGEAGLTPAEWRLDPLTIAVVLNDQGEATGTLYEDEWDTYSLFRGQTRRITYRARREGDDVFIRLGGLDGGWAMPQRRLHVRVLTDQGEWAGRGSERGTIRVDLSSPPLSR
jgi:alpha-glucosidase